MLLLRNLIYTLLLPGLMVGWLPLRVFESGAIWPEHWIWPQLTGLACVVAGGALYFASLWYLIQRGRGTAAPFDPPRKLVQRGPYRWTRNPCYLALLLVVGGEVLFLESWHIAVYFVCLASALQLLVVLHEEPAMGLRYGAMYEDYLRAAPRWFPRRPKPRDTEPAATSPER